MALNISLDGIEESSGSGIAMLPNGPYVLKVVKVDFKPKTKNGKDQNWMDLVWDVAEGPEADALDERPEWTHSEMVSFDDSRLGRTKHILNSISRSNDGWNAVAAWQCVCDPKDPHRAQAIKAFEGKLFGGNVVTYHRQNRGRNADRYPDSTTWRVWQWYDAQQVRDGRDKDGRAIEPLPDMWARGWSKEQADAARGGSHDEAVQPDSISIVDDDIPF